MSIARKRFVPWGPLLPVCVCCWCWLLPVQSVSAAEKAAGGFGRWADAALHTWQKHARSGRGESKHIRLSCWHKAIRELDPLYVYHHHASIVVVLKREDDMEEGVYIRNPISSFLMFGEVDGFELEKADGKGYRRFVRRIPTDHAAPLGGVPAPAHPRQ